MSDNKEEILANFQACTGIEDVAEAIEYLEETNWDLVKAVSKIVPPDSQSFQRQSDPDVMIIDNDPELPTAPKPMVMDKSTDIINLSNNFGRSAFKTPDTPAAREYNFSGASTSRSFASLSNESKMINFTIKYCDKLLKFTLPDTSNLSELKRKITEEISVPPCRQNLSNWARMETYDKTPFSVLMLPPENELTLTVKSIADGLGQEESETAMKLTGTFTLHIKYENKTYDLKYLGVKTIHEVKSDVFNLTSIPIRHQIWTGWPPFIDDISMLALAGINYPEHNLTVRKNPNMDKEKKSLPQIVQIDDSDEDEFEDANEAFNIDDDYLDDNICSRKREPLMPDNVDDEVIGTITFNERFANRYGPVSFYQGTLESALQEACNKPAKDRKILAIYLHHDSSVLTNIFCEFLNFESIMQILEKNFILWGWDVTFDSNRQKIHASLANCLGASAPLSLIHMPVNKFPLLIIIMKYRSVTEVYSIINGNIGVNELLSNLIESVEVFTDHQNVKIKEEAQRAERELVKREQDKAYHESLEADRAKEEAKEKQEKAEREALKRIENEKAENEARKEAKRKEVESLLPSEPTVGEGEQIHIRFRLPKGVNMERRFPADSNLRGLFNYLLVQGYPKDEYKVISSWPRRDLTVMNEGLTLKQLELCPQETVILEER